MSAVSVKRAAVKLSVVKPLIRPIFVAQDTLTSEQVQTVRELMAEANLEGVCVGALVGAEAWDVRPIVVEKGVLTLLRFSAPEMPESSQKEFKDYLEKLSEAPQFRETFFSGMNSGRVWTRRRFYRNTFAESEADIHKQTKLDRLSRFLKIVVLVKGLHSAGIFHGHLVSANITWHEHEAILLDHGFEIFSTVQHLPLGNTHAENGRNADILALGLLMATLFSEELSPEEEKFVASLVSSNATLRPTISQLEEFLSYRIVENKIDADTLPPIIKLTVPHIEEEVDATVIFEHPPVEVEAEPSEVTMALTLPLAQEIRQQRISRRLEFSGKVFLATLSAFLITYIGLYHLYFRNAAPLTHTVSDPLNFWKSRQPSLMREVAIAAVQGHDRASQAVIIQDSFSSEAPQQVRNDLIRVVFDPRWEAALSENDRVLTLRLALQQLLTDQKVELPKLGDAHPAVIYGILGNLPVDAAVEQLKEVPLERLSALPAPIGSAFHELRPLGIYSVADGGVRALCHLLQGKVSDALSARYFENSADDLITFIRLRAIAPFLTGNAALEDSVHLYLLTNSSLFAQMLRWFEDEPLGDWGKVNRTERILMVAGLPPQREFSFEQYADLLLFPAEKIRSQARREISARYFGGRMVPLLAFLGSSANGLTRSQNISILAAFLITGNEADAFYTKWFKEKPDAATVLAMLSARSDASTSDLFNYKAAEYLHGVSWDAPLSLMKRLLTHPEQMARALVYKRLNPENPEELKLLKAMATAEPNKNLREYAQRKASSRP